MKCKNTRRNFLKNSALTGAGVWLAGSSALAESTSANEQIQFACVGVGGKGRSDSSDAGRSGKVVAITRQEGQQINAGQAIMVLD